jgi:hypothetical protein
MAREDFNLIKIPIDSNNNNKKLGDDTNEQNKSTY